MQLRRCKLFSVLLIPIFKLKGLFRVNDSDRLLKWCILDLKCKNRFINFDIFKSLRV